MEQSWVTVKCFGKISSSSQAQNNTAITAGKHRSQLQLMTILMIKTSLLNKSLLIVL
jgi:hypothetical protein